MIGNHIVDTTANNSNSDIARLKAEIAACTRILNVEKSSITAAM